MNPPSSLEPTPARGYPALRFCPHCGKPIPPIASPAPFHAALEPKPSTKVNRAVELEDATPTKVEVDRRLAETERLARDGGEPT